MKLVAVLLCAACYRDAPQPATPPGAVAKAPADAHPESTMDLLEDHLAPVLAGFESLSHDVQSAAGDCPKIAAAFRKFGVAHAADIDEIARLRGELTPEEGQEFDEAHAADAQRLKTVMGDGAMGGCTSDPEVKAALDTAGFRRKKSAP